MRVRSLLLDAAASQRRWSIPYWQPLPQEASELRHFQDQPTGRYGQGLPLLQYRCSVERLPRLPKKRLAARNTMHGYSFDLASEVISSDTGAAQLWLVQRVTRSVEHTSELQSPLRL